MKVSQSGKKNITGSVPFAGNQKKNGKQDTLKYQDGLGNKLNVP